jgi:hypothetical protein
MIWLVDAILSIGTLGGYWMVTHGLPFWGALVGLFSNILWVYYGAEIAESKSIVIVNFVFAIINISIISN